MQPKSKGKYFFSFDSDKEELNRLFHIENNNGNRIFSFMSEDGYCELFSPMGQQTLTNHAKEERPEGEGLGQGKTKKELEKEKIQKIRELISQGKTLRELRKTFTSKNDIFYIKRCLPISNDNLRQIVFWFHGNDLKKTRETALEICEEKGIEGVWIGLKTKVPVNDGGVIVTDDVYKDYEGEEAIILNGIGKDYFDRTTDIF